MRIILNYNFVLIIKVTKFFKESIKIIIRFLTKPFLQTFAIFIFINNKI